MSSFFGPMLFAVIFFFTFVLTPFFPDNYFWTAMIGFSDSLLEIICHSNYSLLHFWVSGVMHVWDKFVFIFCCATIAVIALFLIRVLRELLKGIFASLTRCFLTLKRSMLADIVPSSESLVRSPSQVPYKAVAENLIYDSEDIIFPVNPLLRLPSEILRNESCQTIRRKSITQQPVIVLPFTPLLKQRSL